ncbi:MAG: CBS domain-containing protein [Hahellaceae bacterium]|nr:CBS domain-containing protein [Hahellaceae bacterium]MBK8971209.1 CBS domain-containing protein [Hahellaceae bacterium]
MLKLEEMMSTPVATLTPENSVLDAKRLMEKNDIRHIPIVNHKEKLVGMFTRTDLMAAMDSSVYHLPDEQQEAQQAEIQIADVMRTKVATASLHTSLRDAAEFLVTRKYGCLPIIHEERVVGIVTEGDFVKAMILLLDKLEQA